jgi:prepilin-type processing-associated H-X9-DG protein
MDDRGARRAFTMVELLAVSGVLTLLMAVLLPAVQRAGGCARTAACQGQLRQWGVGFSVFVEEQDTALLNATNVVWDSFWRPYCNDRKRLFVCPMATRYVPGSDDLLRTHWCLPGDKFRAWQLGTHTPTTLEAGPLVGSYGMNYFGPTLPDPRVSRGRPVDRSVVPVFLDRVDFYVQTKATDEPPRYEGHLTSPGDMKRSCLDRHGGGVNSLFLDWSVRKVGLKELWTLHWSPWFDRHGPWTRAGGVQSEDWPAWMRTFKDY